MLEPVLRMIEDGRFDPPRFSLWPQALLTAMVVIVMSVVAVFANGVSAHGVPLEAPGIETVPAYTVFAEDLSPGYLCEEGAYIEYDIPFKSTCGATKFYLPAE